jgi:hypothetical protein
MYMQTWLAGCPKTASNLMSNFKHWFAEDGMLRLQQQDA